MQTGFPAKKKIQFVGLVVKEEKKKINTSEHTETKVTPRREGAAHKRTVPSEVGVHLDHGIARIKRKQKGGVRTLHLPLPIVRNEKVITKKSVLKKTRCFPRSYTPRIPRDSLPLRARGFVLDRYSEPASHVLVDNHY